MKNNTLNKLNKQNDTGFFIRQGSVCGFWVLVGLMASQEGRAQFSNVGDLKVQDNTILSIHEDYNNANSGIFTNDGLVYIFNNWNNDGVVNFSNAKSNGKTFFNGKDGQFIEGKKQSNFQNIQFNNAFEDAPFYLGTEISVSKNAEFIDGIINGIDLPGALLIFNDNATHTNAGNKSFVDGKVKKIGNAKFQFPIGSDKYYRPSEYAEGKETSIYTSQYFHKNSDDGINYRHDKRDVSILSINDQEYWEVKQDEGAEKIILSLTLDHNTTPEAFFSPAPKTKLAIVRWDESQSKWVNEGGELSAAISGEPYSNLLMARVEGYGLFTMALVQEEDDVDDGLIVYNAVSPNGDGLNDTFHIEGLKRFPDNIVEIYNRWGVKVYEAKGYNESDVMFGGYSDGRATINRGEKLPTGTYFYLLKYNNGKKVREKAGYLYINNQ